MNKLWLKSLLFVLIILSSSIQAQEDKFTIANNFFKDKDYENAITTYEEILAEGIESSSLYYNLGNAYFKNGNIGYAVLNYQRALRLDPADEDLLHNIEFANQFTQIQMEGVELNPINKIMESIVGSYKLNLLAWISSAIFILLCILLILRFGLAIHLSVLRISIVVVLILFVAVSGMTTYKYRHDYLTRRAVVVSDDVSVLNGPVKNSEVEFEGAPGLIVEIIDKSGDFYNVLFENKRKGWLPKEDIVEI